MPLGTAVCVVHGVDMGSLCSRDGYRGGHLLWTRCRSSVDRSTTQGEGEGEGVSPTQLI